MVEHHFGATLRNRERNPGTRALELEAACTTEPGLGGVLHRVVQHELRKGHGTVGRIDIDAEVGELLDQDLGAFGQLVAIGVYVLRIDGEQRLLTGERIGTNAGVLVEASRGSGQTAGVGRDGTVRVALFLRAKGRQGGTQRLRLICRHRGMQHT
ncbi:hypothetical protein D3C80_1095190 [compost metagenome]